MIALTIALVVLVIYWPSIAGEFLFDDPAILDMDFPRRNLVVRGRLDWDHPGNRESPPRQCVELMVNNVPGKPLFNRPSFRRGLTWFMEEPRALTHLGYLWTWKIAGFKPVAWHLVNLVLHLANTALVYLAARVFLAPEPASFAAILFAVHPHQVASVAYMSGRAVLQTTFFALAAAITCFYIPVSPWVIPGYFLAVLFASRSKEDGVLWVLLFVIASAVCRIYFGLT